MELLTDWVRVGQSGVTIDGREIDPAWLRDAAAAYDPKLYTAVINIDHWSGNLGTVRELRAVEVGNDVALEARIRPNKNYFIQNQAYGDKLFFSMELTRTFRETGKAYLTGLAATDNPASVGTTEMSFARKTAPDSGIFAGAFTAADYFPECDESCVPEGLFKKFVSSFYQLFSSRQSNPTPQEEEPMNPEMKALFEAQGKAIETLTASVNALTEKLTAKPAEPPEKYAASPEITGLSAAVKQLGENFAAFSVKFESALKTAVPGTESKPQTGVAGTSDDDLC